MSRPGLPGAVDPHEPAHVAEAVAKLGLAHVVVTSVDRDDLADGGAAHFAAVIGAIRAASPTTTIEVLTPIFCASLALWRLSSRPSPMSSTTISKLCRRNISSVRPGARYFHSVRLLQRAKELDPQLFTKSGIMVGLGEDARRNFAAHGRFAQCRCRFSDHRPISPADAQAPSRCLIYAATENSKRSKISLGPRAF